MTFINGKNPETNLFVECANGNTDALNCITVVYNYIDWLDNVIDRDVTHTVEFSGKTSLDLIFTLSYNTFWNLHKEKLGPVLLAGFNSWLDSETMKSNAEYRMRIAADVLKGYFMEFFYVVAYINGGYDLMRTVSKKWRGIDFDCKESQPLSKVVPGREFSFPVDHRLHPDFKIEWRYLSGTFNHQGKLAGYHLCEFVNEGVTHTHFSLTIEDQKPIFMDTDNPVDWDFGIPGRIGVSWDKVSLEFKYDREVVLQGDKGYSKKSDREDHASYYYSIPNLRTKGLICIDDRMIEVEGKSWFDHEWANIIRPPGFGWKFFYAHFDDGSYLNGYLMRENGIGVLDYSKLTYINESGVSEKCGAHDYSLFPIHPDTLKSRLGSYVEAPCKVDFKGKTGFGYYESTN